MIFFFNFRIEDIDNTTQLVSLYCKKTKKSLVQKVPWDQLRPIFTSDMHEVSALEDEEITPLNSTVDSVNDIILLNDKKAATEDTETIFLKEVPAKKRNPGKLEITKKVTQSTHLENSLSNIEKEGFWLTDEHIDHAQHFLADQFKSIDGFQAACVFEPESCNNIGTPNAKFVQIINVNNSHWVTLSNIECTETNELMVYDSLYSHFPAACEEKLYKQIACMLMTGSSNIILKWVNIQKQNNVSDCGLFAIATATALCEGKSPNKYIWKVNNMRSHLANCFRVGNMSMFPFSSETRRCTDNLNKIMSIPVYCYCRQPRTKREMIYCKECLQWFHTECCDAPITNSTVDTLFECMNCKNVVHGD